MGRHYGSLNREVSIGLWRSETFALPETADRPF
jgi:hypothetical protein